MKTFIKAIRDILFDVPNSTRSIRTILLRRGTNTEWNKYNPVLEKNEFVVDLTTRKFKIGDGINAWDGLPYLKGAVISDLWVELVTNSQGIIKAGLEK